VIAYEPDVTGKISTATNKPKILQAAFATTLNFLRPGLQSTMWDKAIANANIVEGGVDTKEGYDLVLSSDMIFWLTRAIRAGKGWINY